MGTFADSKKSQPPRAKTRHLRVATLRQDVGELLKSSHAPLGRGRTARSQRYPYRLGDGGYGTLLKSTPLRLALGISASRGLAFLGGLILG